MGEAPHVLFELADSIGWITLNRPEQLNTLSAEMKERLFAASSECEENPAIRAVVLRGNGKHFMGGGNIKSFLEDREREDTRAYIRGFESRVVDAHQTISQFRRMGKPVLASVHGAVAGFGMSLVLAADLAMASDDAFFTLAYRHIGLTADGGASYFLPRVVGERRRSKSRCWASDLMRTEHARSVWSIGWCRGRSWKRRQAS